jgi:hypothetical protein
MSKDDFWALCRRQARFATEKPNHASAGADQISAELQMNQPPCPAPFAVSHRVGEPAPNGGRFVAIRRHSLAVGEALPLVHLHLSVHESVEIDLEQTYTRASAAAYLS